MLVSLSLVLVFSIMRRLSSLVPSTLPLVMLLSIVLSLTTLSPISSPHVSLSPASLPLVFLFLVSVLAVLLVFSVVAGKGLS